MRRMIPATMAALLALSATPVLAQDADPSAEPTEMQRAEVPELGIAVDFPADWAIHEVGGLRLSAITTADDEPVMETTAFMANGDAGSWCDLDAYLALNAPLEEHAYAYSAYLQRSESPEVAMIVMEEEISAGPAYRIELFDQETGRLRAFYLFDGPPAEDGTFNRFLFTCATRDASQPFWQDLVQTTEVFAPVPAEEIAEETAEEPASDE